MPNCWYDTSQENITRHGRQIRMVCNQMKNEVRYTWYIVLIFSASIWIINAGIDISEALISGGSPPLWEHHGQ